MLIMIIHFWFPEEFMPVAAASVGDGFPPGGNLKEKTLCSTKTKYDESLSPEVCMTPGCIKAGNNIAIIIFITPYLIHLPCSWGWKLSNWKR